VIGTNLAHYRVTAELGAGGMGEVWRASDEKLGREVALKVLPAEFAEDPERMARFEREAKVLASLNHPNIATLYGLETVESGTGTGTGTGTFLAMELVEGEDLSERIKRGPIPVDEVMPIALQIAEALEAAHEQGIVHRDLKPANIKITDEGAVKVLDFGLAKAWQDEGTDLSSSYSPTITRHATVEGVILGTAAYMSPEQARGKKVDRRADIWAFGVVLWEMLTGSKLFEGETITDVLAAILTSEPDLDDLPTETPPHLRTLIGRCLRRDPKRRMRDMGDARIELEEPAEFIEKKSVQDRPAAANRKGALVAWSAAGLMAATALVLGLLVLGESPSPEGGPIALSVVLPPEISFSQKTFRPVVAISPTDDELVIAADGGESHLLFRRSLQSTELTPIVGTEGATAPFYSPDGRWVGFSSNRDRMLKKVSLDGGQVVSLAKGDWGGGSWGEDDTVIYTPAYTDGLWQVSTSGGDARELTSPDPTAGELNHSWPDHIPGTDAVIFTSFRLPLMESRIELYSKATGERRVLVENAVYGRYVAAGFIVFVRDGVMLAAPFNRDTLEFTGSPVPMLEDMFVAIFEGNSQYAISDRGTLAWVPASIVQPPREVVTIDRDGREEILLEADRRYGMPALSPDGRSLALALEDGVPDVWVYDLDRQILNRLTSSTRSEFAPLWFPDGRRLAVVVDDPPFNVYEIRADGSGSPRVLVKNEIDSYPEAFSEDGRQLVIRQTRPDTSSDLELVLLDDSTILSPIRTTKFEEESPTLSPDGTYVAYHADDTGRNEVYVQRFVDGADRIQVSRSGGQDPLWAGNGDLFFWRGRELVVVPVATAPSIEIGAEGVVASTVRHTSTVSREYAITADGQSVIITRTPEVMKSREIQVVMNWFTELERLTGRGGAR
jgi:serine/threonine-protein kinase